MAQLNSSLKRWSAPAAVVLVVLAAGLLLYNLTRPATSLSSSITLVCVESGEIFQKRRDELVQLPTPHPKTGALTLVPCKKQDGVYRVSSHYAPLLEDLKEKNHYVDTQTLQVRTPP